jgi:hypothetical protein
MIQISGLTYLVRVARIGVITAFLTLVAVPAMAASSDPPTVPSFSSRSLAAIVAKTAPPSVLTTNLAPERTKSSTQTPAARKGSFLKTRTGLLVIGVMALGTGYALYSAKNDRIRGSIR